MKLFAAAAALLASAPTIVFGQNSMFLSGLSQALASAGHAQLASAAAKLNGTTAGQLVLSQLSNGSPFLLFAPTDNACRSLRDHSYSVCGAAHACPTVTSESSHVTSNVDTLTDVIAYHIVSGNFTGVSTTYPNTTLGTTLLNDSRVVHLEGPGQPQAVAWATREDGKIHVLNQL